MSVGGGVDDPEDIRCYLLTEKRFGQDKSAFVLRAKGSTKVVGEPAGRISRPSIAMALDCTVDQDPSDADRY